MKAEAFFLITSNQSVYSCESLNIPILLVDKGHREHNEFLIRYSNVTFPTIFASFVSVSVY